MTSIALVRILFLLAVFTAGADLARAQDSRFSFAVKGGLSAESSEDNLQGTSPALGITASLHFAHGWRGEGEFWLPGYIEDARGNPKHRDILFSLSAVKTFQTGKVRPFFVVGLSVTNTQDWFSFCSANRVSGPDGSGAPVLVSCDEPDVVERRRERNDGRDGYLLAGAGIEYPINRNVGIVADLRFSLAPVSVIVRPGIGLVFTF